jgi:hypothetical protein
MAGVLAALCLAALAGPAYADEAWKSYAVGETGLTIEAPGELVEDEFSLPADARGRVLRMESYRYEADGFSLGVSSLTYAKGIEADIKSAEAGVIGGIRGLRGATGLAYTSSPAVVSGVSGVLLAGSFKRDGAAWEFKALLLAEGQVFYQAMASYEAASGKWAPKARRVMDSISIGH